jgi:hypothetical protein
MTPRETRHVAGPIGVGRCARIAGQVAGAAVVVGMWVYGPGPTAPWPMVLVGAGWVVRFAVRAVLRRHELRPLAVDDRGVRLGRVFLPWRDIDEVAVLRDGPRDTSGGAPPEIGLLPRAGAGLPAGLTALVHGPDPEAVPAELRLSTAGWHLDVDGLATAVRVHGGGVPLVERWAGARRVLT